MLGLLLSYSLGQLVLGALLAAAVLVGVLETAVKWAGVANRHAEACRGVRQMLPVTLIAFRPFTGSLRDRTVLLLPVTCPHHSSSSTQIPLPFLSHTYPCLLPPLYHRSSQMASSLQLA
jgi:hypothetical protein